MPSAARIKRQKDLLKRRREVIRIMTRRTLALRFLAERVGKKRIRELDEERKLAEFLEIQTSIRASSGPGKTKTDALMGIGLRELQPGIVDAIRMLKHEKSNPGRVTHSRAIAMLEAADIIETKRTRRGLKITIKDHKRLDNTLKKQKDGYYYIDWGVRLKK